MQVVLILKYEASPGITPFEFAFILHRANDALFEPPLPDVVVHLLSADSDASEIKNNIGHLPHLGLFESICKTDAAFHEFNQTVQDELGQTSCPYHCRFVRIQ
jgi:hypothetical protein